MLMAHLRAQETLQEAEAPSPAPVAANRAAPDAATVRGFQMLADSKRNLALGVLVGRVDVVRHVVGEVLVARLARRLLPRLLLLPCLELLALLLLRRRL